MRNISKLFIPGILLFASCTQEQLENFLTPHLSFMPEVESSVSTKAVSPVLPQEFVCSDEAGTYSIPMFLSCQLNNDNPFTGADVATKGIFDGSDFPTEVGEFYVSAWKETDKSWFLGTDSGKYVTVSYDKESETWILNDSQENPIKWPNDKDSRRFFAYANIGSSAAEVDKENCNQKINSYVVPDQASSQQDLLMGEYFGNTSPEGSSTPSGVVPLKFYHPLSAVSFTVGFLTGVDTETPIASIKLSGVKKTGSVTHEPNGNFTWSASDSTEVTQSVSGDIIPFLLIPQDLSADNVLVEIVLNLAGGERKTVTVTAKLSSGSWKPGYKYIYTIGDNSVAVKVEKTTTGFTFTNNTTSNPLYVRVAVVRTSYGENSKVNESNIVSESQSPVWTVNSDNTYTCELSVGASSDLTITKDPTTNIRAIIQSSSSSFK